MTRLGRIHATAAAILAAGALAGVAGAGGDGTFPTQSPDAFGWSRGDANSAFFSWDFFFTDDFSTANVPGHVVPDPLPMGWPAVQVGELTNTCTLASTANIYCQNNPGFYRFDLPGFDDGEVTAPVEAAPVSLDAAAAPPGSLYTTVLVQMRTLGLRLIRDGSIVVTSDLPMVPPVTPNDPDNDNWPVAGAQPIVDQTVVLFDGPDDVIMAGDIVDETLTFELPGAHPQVFFLFSTGQNTSVDQIAIDTVVRRVPGVAAVCPGDTDGDNTVGPDDLFLLLSNFGAATANGPEDGDVAPVDGPGGSPGDGSVGPDDLFLLLSAFGETCS